MPQITIDKFSIQTLIIFLLLTRELGVPVNTRDRNASSISTETLCDLIRMILTMNNFSFNDKHYLQTHGTAMGTRMAPSYANLFLAKFETYALSLHNGKIVTDLYTKPTDKDQYLLHSSCHPIHTKRAIPFSLPLRLRRICSTNETFTLRTNELIDYLYKRGYNRYFLQREYNELTISHEQKHLRPMTLPYWTNQNVFPSLSPTTQPFVPSHPLFANTFTSLFHRPVAITSLKLYPL